MGRPLDPGTFDEVNRASGEPRIRPLASGSDQDSTDLFSLEAEMLERLLGTEIAALFEE